MMRIENADTPSRRRRPMATALTSKRDDLRRQALDLLKTAEADKRELTGAAVEKFDALKAQMDALEDTIDRARQADEWAPPLPPVATERATADDAEVRVLGRDESVRSWVEAHTGHPREYGSLRLGDVMRAMVTGPRNDLESACSRKAPIAPAASRCPIFSWRRGSTACARRWSSSAPAR
jgi:HK97 family phage major capsid protein